MNDSSYNVFDLSDLAVVQLSGGDATDFLQGQLSNDILALNDEQTHQMSAYCNPKGRILALFHVLKIDTGYALIAPAEVMEKVVPRLKMFVMRSDVSISELSDLSLFGLYASGGIETVRRDVKSHGYSILAGHSLDKNRYFLLTPEKPPGELKSGEDWARLDIRENIPQIYIETYEAMIPQSLNLDIIGGVNFKKGCFPGQEIIARIKYRGKPKSRMIGVKLAGDMSALPGASVYINERSGTAGQVINSARDENTNVLSISVPVSHIFKGNIYVDENKTRVFERIPGPYDITI